LSTADNTTRRGICLSTWKHESRTRRIQLDLRRV
jgi:hypothetical protein